MRIRNEPGGGATAYLLAGANGAGKSSMAPHILGTRLPLERFVNADEIASALDPQDPYAARRRAGAHALERIRVFESARLDFALETTLSGQWTTRLVKRLLANGYEVDLTFIWLPDAEAAVNRVRHRVEYQGGHRVPYDDVRRRFGRGLSNFEALRPILTRWRVVDGRQVDTIRTIAAALGGKITVHEPVAWEEVVASIRQARSDSIGEEGRAIMGDTPKNPKRSRSSKLITTEEANEAIAAADRATVLRHRTLGIPLLLWRDGRMQEVDPFDFQLRSEKAAVENEELRMKNDE